MHILIVGAGATGTVFADALLRDGHAVTFYVRGHHRERLAAGLRLNRQGLFGITSERLPAFGVATTPDEVRAQSFHEVWFSTPSDALRGDWLPPFLAATGDATLVMFQPDPEDMRYLREHGAGDRRIVQGLIQFAAWQSPLPHEPADRDGITLLAPPGPSVLLDAESAEGQTIAASLTRGGLRAACRRHLAAHAAMMSAVMIPLVAGLELAGWKLDRYARHEALRLSLAAAKEAVAAECARAGVDVPLPFRLALNHPSLRVVLALAPWVPGFNTEAFLHYHFSKVDRQTRQMLGTYAAHARANRLDHARLDELLGALPPPSH